MIRTLTGLLLALVMLECVPAAAQPTLYASLPPPKVLLIVQGPEGETLAEHWRAMTPASVTFLELFYNDQSFHHLGDKPLEQTKADQESVVADGDAYRRSVLDRLGDFDVIVTELPAHSSRLEREPILADVHARIQKRIRAGGRLVILGEPLADASMADVMPCRPAAARSWSVGSDSATDHPLVRGLPFDVTGQQVWAPMCQALDSSSIPLTQKSGQNHLWWRRLPGGGQSVYIPQLGGQLSQWSSGTNDQHYRGDRPDDGLVWDALVARLFYWLTYGDRAFPVLANIALPGRQPRRVRTRATRARRAREPFDGAAVGPGVGERLESTLVSSRSRERTADAGEGRATDDRSPAGG